MSRHSWRINAQTLPWIAVTWPPRLDTGVFDEDRYFDVFVEYAKSAADDILMRVTAHNRGPETVEIHVLPLQETGNGAVEIHNC